ncbi:MAG: MarR family transcriptional regulator [Alphaproteobacteria bacterium]|nr:MarR family transcriptional regulator [Alphaproteobacteria bacterium]
MSESLDREILYLLNDVARLIRTRADQRARTHGMTRAQWVILSRLERQPGLSQNEIAAIVEVEPITVARLVDRLESAGLVERRADPKDRRVWRLHLTPAAEPELRELKKHKAALREEVTSGVSATEIEQLIDGLLKLKANLTDGRASLRAV